MKKFYYILFYLVTTASLHAQLETANWYFGHNAGLDFTSGSPVAVTDGMLDTKEGCASISDECGNLLFYTDGVTVYDRNHNEMPNGMGLYGHDSSTQSAIIVPKSGSTHLYYIFTVDETGAVPHKGLRYSLVDMTLNNGNGDIVSGEKNILLWIDGQTRVAEKLAAIPNADYTGYWVVTHYKDTFYAFEVDENGVNPNYINSNVGISVYWPPFSTDAGIGYLKSSPDGTKLAIGHITIQSGQFFTCDGGLAIYDFNRESGVVNNEKVIYNSIETGINRAYYGVEFSPNGNLLYAAFANIQTSLDAYTVQYDLNSEQIIESEKVINIRSEVGLGGALQLALDKKIYQASFGSSHLSVITQPNIILNPDTGSDPSYIQDYIDLNGRTSAHGLPPFIPFRTRILLSAQQEGIYDITNEREFCFGESFLFEFTGCMEKVSSVHWDFGDGNTSTDFNPEYVYASSGTYTVNLEIIVLGNVYTAETEITIHPLPDVENAELAQCAIQEEEVIFDLTESYPQINPNGEDVSYSFHLTEQQAEDNVDSQPINYTTTSSTTLWVRVENEWGCFKVVQLELILNPIPELEFENPIEVCVGSSGTLEVVTDESNTVNWYENETETEPVFTGNPFTTPLLISSTTYYVEAVSEEGCVSERIEVVVEVTDSITPIFDLEEQYCQNSEPEELPTESGNGIMGNWSPATIDTSIIGITTYTFTPDEGQCSEEYSIEIEITDIITPQFFLQEEYCQNQEADELLTESDNGVTGIWFPAFIDTTTPGTQTYTFTPDEGQCSEPYEITVEILETQIPEFDLQAVYCIGTAPEILDTTSDNGITGSWSPNTIDTDTAGTQTYIFTPDEECGEEFILEVEITESIVPEFDIQTQYCLNTTPGILHSTSNNSITGSWSPATIDTGTIGTTIYTFTPDEECAETIEIQITISESIIPEFSNLPDSYCLNSEAEILPTVADNGVSGSWFPQQINTNIQGITIYTFTPDNNQCSEEYQLAVTVYPHPEMEVEEEIVICEGDSYTYTAPDGFDSYTWTDQSNQVISETQEVTFTEEGIYTLTVEINGIPCLLSRNINVSFSTTPVITEIESTENTLTVYATGDGPFEYSLNEIFWQSSNTFHNLEPGIYFVYVRDMKGCGSSAKQGAIMGVPNFISPNGDGYNDTWKIRALEAFPNTRLQIFDRYGKQFLDKILNSDFEWDGRHNSQPLPSGTYWYILTLETGERISGNINLRNY